VQDENSSANPTKVHADKTKQIEPFVRADKTRPMSQKPYTDIGGRRGRGAERAGFI
jgi:hypothetical protein